MKIAIVVCDMRLHRSIRAVRAECGFWDCQHIHKCISGTCHGVHAGLSEMKFAEQEVTWYLSSRSLLGGKICAYKAITKAKGGLAHTEDRKGKSHLWLEMENRIIWKRMQAWLLNDFGFSAQNIYYSRFNQNEMLSLPTPLLPLGMSTGSFLVVWFFPFLLSVT